MHAVIWMYVIKSFKEICCHLGISLKVGWFIRQFQNHSQTISGKCSLWGGSPCTLLSEQFLSLKSLCTGGVWASLEICQLVSFDIMNFHYNTGVEHLSVSSALLKNFIIEVWHYFLASLTRRIIYILSCRERDSFLLPAFGFVFISFRWALVIECWLTLSSWACHDQFYSRFHLTTYSLLSCSAALEKAITMPFFGKFVRVSRLQLIYPHWFLLWFPFCNFI